MAESSLVRFHHETHCGAVSNWFTFNGIQLCLMVDGIREYVKRYVLLLPLLGYRKRTIKPGLDRTLGHPDRVS